MVYSPAIADPDLFLNDLDAVLDLLEVIRK
jgi:hypothetical protein